MGYNPYIPWDVGLFYDAVINLRSVIGIAFNIGFWIFMILSGVYLVLKLVGMFGK